MENLNFFLFRLHLKKLLKEFACGSGDMEMWVRSLGWEDPLQEELATHYSILVWEIPWTGKPDGLQSKGLQKSRHHFVNK